MTFCSQFECGPNLVVTVLHKSLNQFLSDQKFLPRILVLNFDNCGRENKNKYVFAYCYTLVELGIVEEIIVCFLLVGHTGNIVDQGRESLY